MLKIYKKNDFEIQKKTVKNKNNQKIAPNSAKKITKVQLQIQQRKLPESSFKFSKKLPENSSNLAKKLSENSAKNSPKFSKENYQIAPNSAKKLQKNSNSVKNITKKQLQA
ncbi:24594_t:CDS:2, partial [Gigaspora margarita]